MNSKYRYLVPNGITFLSLTCGIVSILLSASGHLQPAGILVLASYILDVFDGALARKLKASSEFGLQLDSLVDMVSLGTAPAVLVFMHLQMDGLTMGWIWPFVVMIPLAGAFRLARFNLLPPKKSGNSDSVGLTISTGGATLALAVLADLAIPSEWINDYWYILLLAVVAVLMVSTIEFPSLKGVFSGWRKSAIILSLFGVSVTQMPIFAAWFLWTNAYLGLYVARAGYKRLS